MARSALAVELPRVAFDREAAVYDAAFGVNPSGLVFRRVFQDRLFRSFPPGTRVLDLGCGTGDDAIALAETGRVVHAIDPSPRMIERARAKAGARAIAGSHLSFDVRAAEDGGFDGGATFDGAYSDFGALSCTDLGRVGEALARALKPGARLVLSLIGRHPLPALAHRLLTGRGEPRGRREPKVAGVSVSTWYATVREARARIGPAFAWRRAFALGVLLPGPDHPGWALRNPQAFGLLAAVEGLLRHWPVLRGLGDHVVVEGVRR